MRNYLLAAVAVLAIATPAAARDGSPYVGIEGGILHIPITHDDYQGSTGATDGPIAIHHNLGVDVDAIAGYDFGFIRAEAELGYKRAGIGHTNPDMPNFIFTNDDSGHARTVSAMGNLLADFGSSTGVSGYIGGGIGVARTSYLIRSISFGATDSNLAWQIIAGLRFPVSQNIDVGVKYRYFTTKYDLEETQTEEVLGRWRSHSLLASLVYNFGGVAAPPPPPPP
ncbi:MAG TPA: outer membrane beta-barrel protein, partial [Sphingomicrobium sp.]|nr:outer membrane beta-barrel protein [Sphingomicrobium sp.]